MNVTNHDYQTPTRRWVCKGGVLGRQLIEATSIVRAAEEYQARHKNAGHEVPDVRVHPEGGSHVTKVRAPGVRK